MLQRRTVVRFHDQVEHSRTQPSLVFCEDEEGEETEFFLKLVNSGERRAIGLACEIMAAQFATDLGLPIPEACLLEVTPEFVSTLQLPKVAESFKRSIGRNFGSTKAPAGFSVVLPQRTPPVEQRQTAAEIFAFDAMIQNADRRTNNPNCLTNGGKYTIIDHELAFDFVGGAVIGWKPPWGGGNLRFLHNHIFFQALQRAPMNFDRLAGAFEALPEERIKSYTSSIPLEWEGGQDAAQEVLSYLLRLRMNIPATLEAIHGVLR